MKKNEESYIDEIKTDKFQKRFKKNTKKGNKGCIEWIGSTTEDGYGQLGIGQNKVVKAHRVAWEMNNGQLEPGKRLRCSCGNKRCVNANHWEILIRKEYIPKGRAHLKGEENGNSSLKAKDVRRIRKLAQKKSYREISLEYQLSATQISRIVRKQAWSHVE